MKIGIIVDECIIGNGIWITSSSVESVHIRDSDVGAVRCLALHSKMDFNIFNSTLSRGKEIANSKFENKFSVVSTEAEDFFLLSVCDFEDRVTISDVKWPSGQGGHVAADGSRFSDVLTLDSVEPQAIRFFSGTYLDSGLNLSNLDNNALKKAVQTEISELKKELKRGNAFQNVADIEAGCRIIRKQKEASGDTNSEQFWHNMELISRNNRSDIGIPGKIFSIFYYIIRTTDHQY